MAYEVHDFYCINCGNKGIPVARCKGQLRGKSHLKKLYCINCHCEVNHIEIRTPDELEKFKGDFKNGCYKKQAEESIRVCRDSRMW